MDIAASAAARPASQPIRGDEARKRDVFAQLIYNVNWSTLEVKKSVPDVPEGTVHCKHQRRRMFRSLLQAEACSRELHYAKYSCASSPQRPSPRTRSCSSFSSTEPRQNVSAATMGRAQHTPALKMGTSFSSRSARPPSSFHGYDGNPSPASACADTFPVQTSARHPRRICVSHT